MPWSAEVQGERDARGSTASWRVVTEAARQLEPSDHAPIEMVIEPD